MLWADRMLDIRDAVNGYIHYVLKGPTPVDPRATLSNRFRKYAIDIISTHRKRAVETESQVAKKRARRA